MNSHELKIRYLETTGRCNLDCPVCVERYRNFDMDMDDFYAIADANEALLQGEWIWMDFNGEPLLDPHFFTRVKYLKQKDVTIQLSTNAILLDEKNCMNILESGVDYLVISVVTLDRELYQRIRGVDMLPQILNNAKRMKQMADEAHSSIELQAVAIDTGTNDLKSFISYFHDLGMHAAVHNFTNRANCSRLTYMTEHQHLQHRGACQGLKQNIGILNNCDVVTCCSDFKGRNALGNLRDFHYSVADLIQASTLDEMLSKQDEQIFTGACSLCSDWIYYQRDSKEKYVTVYPVYGGVE